MSEVAAKYGHDFNDGQSEVDINDLIGTRTFTYVNLGAILKADVATRVGISQLVLGGPVNEMREQQKQAITFERKRLSQLLGKSDDPIAAICPHILREVSLEKGEAKFNCLVCGERGAADLDLTSTNLYG